MRAIQMYKKNCIQCGGSNLKILIDLGTQPWCNDFTLKKVKKYPLKVYICNDCSGGQLTHFVNKKKMFLQNYYLSGDNKELINHFRKFSYKIKKQYKSTKKDKKSILDIGSNDGSFLKFFSKEWDLLGVDPSIKANTISKKFKIKSLKTFFNYNVAEKVKKEFDVIHASGVFFHIEELLSITKGIKILLKTKGILVIQFIYLNELIAKKHFDQIYHEHLYYYNLKSLQFLLNRYDLEIFHAEKNKIHGGSMIAYISHKGIRKRSKQLENLVKAENKNKLKFWKDVDSFQYTVNEMKKNFYEKLKKLIKKGYQVSILGVPAKGSTVVNYFNINSNQIKNSYDINQFKIGNNIPGTKIKIQHENRIKKINKKDIFLILSWNYKSTIVKKFKKKFGKKFKYFFPYQNK
tara:strand:+ start:569 stop:1783 length:1215 start_codon:yes stop_codon:yes gene_type:complete